MGIWKLFTNQDFMLHFIGVAFFLLGSFGRKSSILNLSPHFCTQSDGNESILYFRRGMISGDKVAPIIVQLVAFF